MTVAEIAEQMLDTYPRSFNLDKRLIVDCIAACHECAEACTQCADDCLSEDTSLAELAKCIRLNQDCADLALTTARVVSRQTEYDANLTRAVLEACMQACKSCGDECSHHAEHMEHCRICAAACERCGMACEQLLSAI